MTMKSIKRILAGVLALAAGCAMAQAYPNRPVNVIVVYPAGAVADTMLRVVAEKLGNDFGLRMVLENRPGGSGIGGTRAVASAKPDGYTLLMTGVNHVTNTGLFTKLPYDTFRDFTPIGVIGRVPVVLVANPGAGYKTVQDLVRAAKARPGEINFASSGVGTAGHLATESFARAAGVKLNHIPYKGGPQALTDTVSGQVQINTLAYPIAAQFIKDGRLVPLLQAGKERNKALPGVPNMEELGMGKFIIDAWFGLLAPANMDPAARAFLKNALAKVMADPEIIAKLESQGFLPGTADPTELEQLLTQQIAQLPGFMADIGVKPE
jgi:tripartite-type tricarboxylate transporter receptor subunit TctC